MIFPLPPASSLPVTTVSTVSSMSRPKYIVLPLNLILTFNRALLPTNAEITECKYPQIEIASNDNSTNCETELFSRFPFLILTFE